VGAEDVGNATASPSKSLGKIEAKFSKGDYIWAKSNSCIPKNIRSPTALIV